MHVSRNPRSRRPDHDPSWGARHAVAGALLICGAFTAHAPAFGQSGARVVLPPPVAHLQRPGTGPTPQAAGNVVSSGGEALVDLNITYTDATIYNPETNRDDPVHLRSYRDVNEPAPPSVPFVAPTIAISPGETV